MAGSPSTTRRSTRGTPERLAIGAFGACPAVERAQVWARWLSCPLPVLESYAPVAGRILEVGCGRGLTSLYLALCDTDREVVGIDIDGAKVAVAQRARTRLADSDAHVSFHHLPAGELPDDHFDAVVFADVLYLLTDDEREDMLRQAIKRIRPDGLLIIKEDGLTPRWKHAVDLTHNWLLRFVLGNLEGDTMSQVEPDWYATWLRDAGMTTMVRRLDRGYPYAHFLVVARPDDLG